MESNSEKKRKYNLSSDEEGFLDVGQLQKYKKTGSMKIMDSDDSPSVIAEEAVADASKRKTKYSDFLSLESGSESGDDTAEEDINNKHNEIRNRANSLRKMFPEFSEETLLRVCKSTFSTYGAIAALSRWKSEDIKKMSDTDEQPGEDNFDFPVVTARRKKNCLRLDSSEKERKPTSHNTNANGDKKSARRLGLSSSESETDDDNAGMKSKGPFPRLSCVVKSAATCPIEITTLGGGDKKGYQVAEIGNDKDTVKVWKSNGMSSKSKNGAFGRVTKPAPSNKLLKSNSLMIDDALDENFSNEGSHDCDSSDDEFSSLGFVQRKTILEFFQVAGMDELVTMESCSKKKAQMLLELRPFSSWSDLVRKLEKTRSLGTVAVMHCATLLKGRDVLDKLLRQCRSISNNLSSEIEKLHCQAHMTTAGSVLIKAPNTIPSRLKLKDYQLVGLNWIALLHRNNVNGILADEMGLGKTVQTISFLAYLFEQDPETGPHVVVVPSSTLDNWCREFSLWCPGLDVIQYRGNQSERRMLRVELSRGRQTNVIVTTYNTAISTSEDRSFFRKMEIQYAVFDEGHMLKNMSSQRYLSLMKFNASKRLLLTGTPLQNNLLELMSLLRFVMPQMFEQTADTLTRIFSSLSAESQGKFAKDRIRDARDIMQPFVLRRLKSEVLHQLPTKTNDIIYCDMTNEQRELYEETKEKFRLKLNERSKFEMKNAFMELRKVTNHPLLRRHIYTKDILVSMARLLKRTPEYRDSVEHLMVEDMTVMDDFELHCFCQSTGAIRQFALDESKILNCGKFKTLDTLLPRFKSKDCRVVIFSQFTMVMNILEKYLEHRSHKFLRLDGSTPVNTRLGLIDQFEADPSILVFLLSTKAGGLGVNLTAANAVIMHDIDINPYNDKQAEDRCHRLGQTKDVEIVRLISKDSIEEGMLQLVDSKLKLEQEMTNTEDESCDIATLLQKTLAK